MENVFELKCRTAPSTVAFVHGFIDERLKRFDPDGLWLSDVHVIADELISNIEKFAYGDGNGQYKVRLSITEDTLRIDLEDGGREFDPTKIEETPLDGSADRAPGNLGLLLVMSLADDVCYSRRDGLNITTIVVRISERSKIQEGGP